MQPNAQDIRFLIKNYHLKKNIYFCIFTGVGRRILQPGEQSVKRWRLLHGHPQSQPLNPTPPTTQSSIGSFEKLPSPKHEIDSGDLASFAYLNMYHPSGQHSPVKLTPLSDDLALDFCPPSSDDGTRQMFKTR